MRVSLMMLAALFVLPGAVLGQFGDGPDFLVDTGFAYTPAHPGQGQPVAAFDGTNFLVVWEDSRGGESDIYAARVTPGGVLLDSAGFPVSTARDRQWYADVSFDGANFFVVWWDLRDLSLIHI